MIDAASKKTKRNLTIFTVMVLLSGWIGVLVDTLIPAQEPGYSLGMTFWLVIPLLTAVLLRTFGGDGWKDSGLLPRFRGNIKWYVICFFIFPLVTLMVVALGLVLGWIDASNFNINAFMIAFAGGLLINLIINFFEQSVWMGYLTSKLLKLKMSDLCIYIIVAVVWGLFWHLPYYLIFLPFEDLQLIIPLERWMVVLWTFPIYICWGVMFIEIYRITKSIWPVVITHMAEDALFNAILFGGFIEVAHRREIFISPWIGAIPALVYLSIGLILRKHRKSKEVCAE